MQELEEILRKSIQTQKQKQRYNSIKHSPCKQTVMEEDYEEVIEDEVNYYQLRMQEQSKLKKEGEIQE
jgi:hypothetical protein